MPDDVIISILGYPHDHNESSINILAVSTSEDIDVTRIDTDQKRLTKNQLVAIVSQIVQEVQKRAATPGDLQVYVPILMKYGLAKGKLIVSRSLKTTSLDGTQPQNV